MNHKCLVSLNRNALSIISTKSPVSEDGLIYKSIGAKIRDVVMYGINNLLTLLRIKH